MEFFCCETRKPQKIMPKICKIGSRDRERSKEFRPQASEKFGVTRCFAGEGSRASMPSFNFHGTFFASSSVALNWTI